MAKFHAIGRRKTSVARVYMDEGTGTITVNSKDYKDYFNTAPLHYKLEQPFSLTETTGKYDVKVNVFGGGILVKQRQFVWVYLVFFLRLITRTAHR